MADEAQDCSTAGLYILNKLYDVGLPLVVVADPDQASYGFRGAATHALTTLAGRLGRHDLTHNWRSTIVICTTLPKTCAGPPPADRALAVPDQHPRHRPTPVMSCHHPANRSAAVRVGISSAVSQREYAHTMVSTGSCTGLRTSPQPCLVGATGFEPVTPRL